MRLNETVRFCEHEPRDNTNTLALARKYWEIEGNANRCVLSVREDNQWPVRQS